MKTYKIDLQMNPKKMRYYKRRRAKKRLLGTALLLAVLTLFVVLLVVIRLIIGALGGNGPSPVGDFLPFPAGPKEGPPYVIALDAGHGGRDVGAEGIIREVELTEGTVKALYALLEADPNFTPMLCREYGEGATPAQRAQAASKAGAGLLLSVHGNSDYGEGSYGFECYPAPPGRRWHDGSLRFANLLAAEMQDAGSRLRGENGVRYVYYTQNGDSSEKVFREASDTGEYDDPSFGVVENPNCPAVLVEQCFITNESDLASFGGEEGCRRAAECYYRAICAYFEV